MAGIAGSLYNTFFRSNAVMLSTVFVGAFAFQIGFDAASTKVWDRINSGRQWKDIKAKYVQVAEDEEE